MARECFTSYRIIQSRITQAHLGRTALNRSPPYMVMQNQHVTTKK